MPSKEEFRKQVEVGVEYAAKEKLLSYSFDGLLVDHLTDHLWGTVGMWLQKQEGEHIQKLYDKFSVKRIDNKPIFTTTLEQDEVHMGIDEIDEHEGEVSV